MLLLFYRVPNLNFVESSKKGGRAYTFDFTDKSFFSIFNVTSSKIIKIVIVK